MKKIIKNLITVLALTFFGMHIIHAKENMLHIGDENAKITVRVFSSLTCPHCANFHNKIFKNLKKEYIDTKKVKFEHHGFPLDLAALNAERILRSISDDEKSFKFLGILYEKQNEWAVGSDIKKINKSLIELGRNFGLDVNKMESFLKDEKIQDQILNERISAQKNYNISSTPTIYVNKKKYEGKHEFNSFKKVLDKN